MILKEQLFLSNCDSIHARSEKDLRKRLLIGAACAEGIVLSVNMLVDNAHIAGALETSSLCKWFKGEGSGKLFLRGMFEGDRVCLVDYFEALPREHVFSRFGRRSKAAVTKTGERDTLLRDLNLLDGMLETYAAQHESIPRCRKALSCEIAKRLARTPDAKVLLDKAAEGTLVSRSQWYGHLDAVHPNTNKRERDQRERIRVSKIDAAYNTLFVKKGEAFAMDRMPIPDRLPESLFDAMVEFRNNPELKDNLRTVARRFSPVAKLFSFIAPLGSDEPDNFLTDVAHFIKAMNLGKTWFDGRNWYDLFPGLKSVIGVEIVDATGGSPGGC